MPSTNKTQFLNLNSWLGTDKPKRDDFNSDNQKIDSAVQAHFENASLHVSEQDREFWEHGSFILGSYSGNAVNPREISLGFKPRFALVYGVNVLPIEYWNVPQQNKARIGLFSQSGCSVGCALTDNGIKVWSTEENAPDGVAPHLNAQGVTYVYIAFK